jgi:ribosomal protein S18 acetylase RimI-like enzyme
LSPALTTKRTGRSGQPANAAEGGRSGEVAYRFASRADIGPVLALWRAAGAHPTVTDDALALEVLIARDPGGLLIAEHGEEIVGSLIAGWNGWRGSLYRLAVSPKAQRQGVATELVRRAIDELQRRGARRIDAFVVTADEQALQFWDSLADLGLHRDAPKTRYVIEPR